MSKKIRIRIIFPGTDQEFHPQNRFKDFQSDDLEVEIVCLQFGPETIASQEALYEEIGRVQAQLFWLKKVST